jgi:hypothetical protein
MCKDFPSGCECPDCREEFARAFKACLAPDALRDRAETLNDGAARAAVLRLADQLESGQ